MTDDSAPVTETSETAPAKKRKGWPKGRRRKFRPVETVSRSREVSVERPPMREEAFVYKPEEDDDRLYVPRDIIPPGMDYQWVTCKIYGRPEPQRLARFQRQGWSPVPADRHEGLYMPRGYTGPIEIDGLMLHERPMEYTRQARLHEAKKARNQIAIKEAQLKGGDLPNVTLDSRHQTAVASNRIRSSFERLTIPED